MAKLPFIKSASQQDLGRPQGPKPYKVGLALSGGGARGFAHAGALMALEEAGLKPEIVAGVSAGSVIAVLYGAGMRPLEMAQLFAKSSFRDFAEFSLGKGGFFRIDRFGDFILGAIKKYRNLEELPMPVLLGATDLDNGRSVIFDRGPIAPRLVASCSIPIVFKPVNINGVNYVDGGVLRNHPAWMLRDKCDLLIGVNVSPLRNDPNYNSVVSIAMRTYNLMAKANQSADMDLCDVSVQTTDIADMAVFDLKNIKRIFVSGYVQTRDALRAAGLWKPEQKEAAK